jgi:hypothetical protein
MVVRLPATGGARRRRREERLSNVERAYTVGRRVLAETGRVRAVEKQLAIGSGGFTGTIYSNRDADQLETTIRRLRRQLQQPSPPAVAEWWKEPVSRLVDHIAEERNLIELS